MSPPVGTDDESGRATGIFPPIACIFLLPILISLGNGVTGVRVVGRELIVGLHVGYGVGGGVGLLVKFNIVFVSLIDIESLS